MTNQTCVLHPRHPRQSRPHKLKSLNHKEFYRHGDVLVPSPTNNFLMAPRSLNHSESGEISREDAKQLGSLQTIHVKLPPIGTLDRLATDYEPIENIAERNKLNIRQYLDSSKTSRAARRESLKLTEEKSLEDVYVQSTRIM